VTGVDLTQHAETAYDFGGIHLGHTTSSAGANQEVPGRKSESITG
jgi:hypothetical protein